MNYFAHGREYLDQPYFLAGTAIPDWLNVVDRRIRARSRYAAPLADHADPRRAAIARGVLQHHHDDRWFHQTRAFNELSLEFSRVLREKLPSDDSFRPSFLGHILVELLLDAELIHEAPQHLDDYYRAIDQLDPQLVSTVVYEMTGHQADRLSLLIPRFSRERFLYDYAEDGKLLMRLNHVMRRVKLPALPEHVAETFPAARGMVRRRRAELLAEPAGG